MPFAVQVRPYNYDGFAGAPAGNLFFDWEYGDDSNNGLTAATAKRSINALINGSPYAAGTIIVMRAGPYRTAIDPPDNMSTMGTVTFNGTVGSLCRIRVWGTHPDTGSFAMFYGDRFVRDSDWKAITPGTGDGNSFLEANGREFLAPLGWGPECVPFVGPAMLFPSFWSPTMANPTDPQWAAQDWRETRPSSASHRRLSTAEIQQSSWALGAPGDTSRELYGYLVSGVQQDITWKNPAIAAWYGGSPNMSAARVYFRGGANLTFGYNIAANGGAGYNQGASTLNWRTDTTGIATDPTTTSCFLQVAFHQKDIRQIGQYGFMPTGASRPYRAVLPSNRGYKSFSRWYRGLTFAGTYLTVEGDIGFGRTRSGPSTNNGYAFELGALTNFNFTGKLKFEQNLGYSNKQLCMLSSSASSGIIEWIIVDDQDAAGSLDLNGLNGQSVTTEFRRGTLGNTNESAISGDGGMRNVLFKDLEMSGNHSPHGNMMTNYGQNQDITYANVLAVDSLIPIAAQTSVVTTNIDPTNGKRMTWRNSVLGQARQVSTNPAAAYADTGTPSLAVRSDGKDCLMDRLICYYGGSNALYLSDPGTSDGVFRGFDNMIMRRSVFESVGFHPLVATAQPRTSGGVAYGSPPMVTDCCIEQAVTAWNGVSNQRNRLTTAGLLNGVLTDAGWEVMSRTLANTTGEAGAHESFALGPSWLSWTIPTWDGTSGVPATGIGSLVDLYLTKSRVWQNHEPGRSVGSLMRWRPRSFLSLPAGIDSNDLFRLQNWTLFAVVPITGPMWVTVRETAFNGTSRDTRFQITTRSW